MMCRSSPLTERRSLAKALRTRDKLLAGGLINSLFLYIAINLMMVIGLAPVVGIPLPLVSYGGSSMMAAMLSIGLLMGIDRANRRSPTDIHA